MMRTGSRLAVVVVVAWCAIAGARPKPAAPAKTDADQLDALEKERNELWAKQAYARGVPIARRIFALAEKVHGKDDRETIGAEDSLAQFLELAGDYAEAMVVSQDLVRRSEKTFGPDSQG